MESISNIEIIKFLASQNPQEANLAAHNVLNQGISILPMLLKYQGDRRIFMGTALINPRASILLPMSIEGFPIPESQMERATTMEVAALYLISAVYYDKLPFAHAPLLIDETVKRGEREAKNTKEFLELGYKSAKQWIQECQIKGLDAMRQAGRTPLADAHLSWY
ncbi:MAG: hypothetical protein NTX45_22560 [Proteobacteria bacterium]|nr:hypothetical protein [Pseudomonadota bacterium]